MTGESRRTTRARIPAELLAVLIALLVGLSLTWNQIHVMSGDLALHYQLAQRIADTWRWPLGDKSFASNMQLYPPLAHYMAAILAMVMGSTFTAMNVISITCVFGCYLLLSRSLCIQNARAGAAPLALVAVGLLVARSQHAAEGFEVDFNFFYAQMVGEFVFLLFVFWLCRTRLSWPWRLAATGVVTIVTCWVYLIAAVEIALACICLEGFILLRRIVAARTIRLSWLVPMVASGLVLPLLIVVNPSFRIMIMIAANNGELHILAFQRLVPVFAVILLAVAVAIGLLSSSDTPRWRGGTLFLATAGSATAVAALIQVLDQAISHSGSEYAINKYSFSVITILVFALGAVLAGRVEKGKLAPAPSPVIRILTPAVLAVLATVSMHAERGERLDKFVKYQNQVRTFVAEKKGPADLFGSTSSRNPSFRYPLNHVVTLVDLGLEPQAALRATDASLDPSITPPETYSFVDDRFHTIPPKCILQTLHTEMVLVSLPCQRITPPILTLDKTISVAGSPFRLPYLLTGWSATEPSGVWGYKHATLGMHLDRLPDPIAVTMWVAGYLPTPTYVQHVPISVGGVPVATWTFDAHAPSGARTLVIPAALAPHGDLMLDFDFPDATTAAALKVSADQRLLGMYFSGLSVSALYPDIVRGQTVTLAKTMSTPPYFRSGWGAKEPGAVWTDGHSASLMLHIDKAGPLTVSVQAMAFLAHPDSVQNVIVRAGQTRLAAWRYDKASASGLRTVKVPADLIRNGNLELDLDLPDAASPAEQKVSGDTRRLGLYVSVITVN